MPLTESNNGAISECCRVLNIFSKCFGETLNVYETGDTRNPASIFHSFCTQNVIRGSEWVQWTKQKSNVKIQTCSKKRDLCCWSGDFLSVLGCFSVNMGNFDARNVRGESSSANSQFVQTVKAVPLNCRFVLKFVLLIFAQNIFVRSFGIFS